MFLPEGGEMFRHTKIYSKTRRGRLWLSSPHFSLAKSPNYDIMIIVFGDIAQLGEHLLDV